MAPIDCPLYNGSWVCNVCVRTGRDFRYTFCRLSFPARMSEGCSLARTVNGASPPTAPGFGPDERVQYISEQGGARGGGTPSTGEHSEAPSIDPAVIESDLYGVIDRAINSSINLGGNEFHTRVQRNVASAAKRHGLSGAREYPISYETVNKLGKSVTAYGLIDVMWYHDSSLIAAIEIDSCHRKMSIAKLMASEAKYKFWICYGNIRVRDLMEIDHDIISVIQCRR